MNHNTNTQTETNGKCCRLLKILAWGDFQGKVEACDLKRLKDSIGNSPNHLEKIYEEQMEWARHFNQLIWTISAIIVPASLAGLVLSFRDVNGNFVFEWFLATAVGSFFLVLYWALQVFWHVSLWRRAFILAGLIEEKWGVRGSENDVVKYESHLLSKLTPYDLGKWYVWIFIVFFMLAWGLRGCLELCK